jgi:hypothetical protein
MEKINFEDIGILCKMKAEKEFGSWYDYDTRTYYDNFKFESIDYIDGTVSGKRVELEKFKWHIEITKAGKTPLLIDGTFVNESMNDMIVNTDYYITDYEKQELEKFKKKEGF